MTAGERNQEEGKEKETRQRRGRQPRRVGAAARQRRGASEAAGGGAGGRDPREGDRPNRKRSPSRRGAPAGGLNQEHRRALSQPELATIPSLVKA